MPKQKDRHEESEIVPPWDEFHLFLEGIKPNLLIKGIRLFNIQVSATNTKTNRSGSGILFRHREFVMLVGAENRQTEIGFTRLSIDLKAADLKARYSEWLNREDIVRDWDPDTVSAIQNSGNIVSANQYNWTKTI
ncbi:hypothetical protein HYW54_01890 [Candidatus Gottesmanbacteria bacterium]|nr:hypothetical protein [Candidatus Gottesmanbacteria bacterium]